MREDEKFCLTYLQTMNPERAAESVGKTDGFSALGQKSVQNRLEKMRTCLSGQIRREDVLQRLAQLAFGRANDAIRLALNPKQVNPDLLDLSAVSEFKVTEKGVEVKLIDRVRALENLYQLLDSADKNGADELYRALEDAAGEMEDSWRNG